MTELGRGRAARVFRGAMLLAALPALLGVQVYHSEAEALTLAFPDATRLEEHAYVVDEAVRRVASERAGSPVSEHLVRFHAAWHDGELVGHAVVLKEIGKALPFRFLVAIRPDGAVDQVLLLDYREPRGQEIGRDSFRRQYEARTLDDPIRRGQDVRNITGATLSVDSLSRGVRRALALYEALVGTPGRE